MIRTFKLKIDMDFIKGTTIYDGVPTKDIDLVFLVNECLEDTGITAVKMLNPKKRKKVKR